MTLWLRLGICGGKKRNHEKKMSERGKKKKTGIKIGSTKTRVMGLCIGSTDVKFFSHTLQMTR